MLVDVPEACACLDSITDRQKEVLDRVLQHRTSKEIARELNIAPNTVDQRINAVRDKLGAKDRAETARLYARLNQICGRTICGPTVVDHTADATLTGERDDEIDPVFSLNDSATFAFGDWDDIGEFAGPRAKLTDSKLWRMVAIVAIAVGTAAIAVTILAVMQALNAMI